jgi:sterol 3beta-glucosyltransferase
VKILITTVGSRGDVQPYVALGAGLRDRGHSVTVCTSVRFQPFVVEQGLGYAYLNDDLLLLLDSAEGRNALEDMGSFLTGARTAVRLLKRAGPIQRSLLDEGWEAARAVEPDVIIYHSKMSGAPHYADKLGIPAIMAVPFPQLVPTAAHPTIGFPRWKLGGWYNRASYRVVLAIGARVGRSYIRDWRLAHGLPPLSRGAGVLHRSDGSRIPVMHCFSRHVVPPPADWPESSVVTGYWFLNREREWEPPAALADFLAAGNPPAYVGFGSMAGRDPQRVTEVVVAALQKAGLRGVLSSGWGGLTSAGLPGTIFPLGDVPHEWLFPRMAAVVHHGGAGTTAAGLRAGRPTVICPFFGDQPFWGRRAHELGVGSKPIPQKKLTVARLAAALTEVTTNDGIRRSAEALGEKIRAEDGIGVAGAMIEGLVAPDPRLIAGNRR